MTEAWLLALILACQSPTPEYVMWLPSRQVCETTASSLRDHLVGELSGATFVCASSYDAVAVLNPVLPYEIGERCWGGP